MTPDDGRPGHPIVRRRFDELTVAELHDIVRLRTDVFVVEQECAYPELDGRDPEPGTLHAWIEVEGEIAAYARVLAEADGIVRVGRVVTHRDHRGGGLARHLVRAIRDDTTAEIVLDAQTYLVGWYEAEGFAVAGPEFVEDGIPHVPMRRLPVTSSGGAPASSARTRRR